MISITDLATVSAMTAAATSGLTQVLKESTNLDGRYAHLLTVGIGAILTVGADYGLFNPTDARGWILVVLHGLIVGLTVAGLYKTAAALLVKAQTPAATTPQSPAK